MSDKTLSYGTKLAVMPYEVDYEKNESNDEKRIIYRTNFLIIREIFNLIKDKRIGNSEFYAFLFNVNKSDSEVVMTSIINTGYGNIEKYSKLLIEYGLSKEYFSKDNPEYIQACDETLKNYISYVKYADNRLNNSNARKMQRKSLLYNIFNVKNKDGSLVVDCLRNMLLDYMNINSESNPELYDISSHIVSDEAIQYLTQNQLKKYYKDTAINFVKYNEFNQISTLPETTRKNIYGKANNGFNLLLIRESYLVLSQIDADRPDALERFYNFLGISETDYQIMIDKNSAPNKKLAELLTRFKYPASLFRGDTPTQFDISEDILNANSKDLNHVLKIYLCYKISPDNIGLVIPTLALIKHLYPEN